MIDSYQLFIIWISFSILVIGATLPFVVWAIRSGQFSKFDYASRLPLRSRIEEEPPSSDKTKNNNVVGEENVSA